jgi:hypothetical protein
MNFAMLRTNEEIVIQYESFESLPRCNNVCDPCSGILQLFEKFLYVKLPLAQIALHGFFLSLMYVVSSSVSLSDHIFPLHGTSF